MALKYADTAYAIRFLRLLTMPFTKTAAFKTGSKQQEHNLIDALKICCRKFSKEKTGKKPFTNINLVRI